jgi:hypothetical protein
MSHRKLGKSLSLPALAHGIAVMTSSRSLTEIAFCNFVNAICGAQNRFLFVASNSKPFSAELGENSH